jgi:orotidine-5'-phosphate decarboxylase
VAPPRILAVTALTSLDDAAVSALGFGPSAAAMAERLAEVAVQAGVGGLVCSPREVPALRARYPALFLCTPGIRPAGAAAGDQARTETPASAIQSGASLLVVGRPLHAAPDPAAAARALEAEVATALSR